MKAALKMVHKDKSLSKVVLRCCKSEVTYLSSLTVTLLLSTGDDDDGTGGGVDGSLLNTFVQKEPFALESFAVLRFLSSADSRSFSIMVLTTASELSRPSRQSDAYILAQRTFAGKSKSFIQDWKYVAFNRQYYQPRWQAVTLREDFTPCWQNISKHHQIISTLYDGSSLPALQAQLP
jgi:hypothetical protein